MIATYQKHAAAALDRWVRAGQPDAPPPAELPQSPRALPAAPTSVEVVDSVTMPQPVLNELLAELHAGREEASANREERRVTLNLIMQVTQRLAAPVAQALPAVAAQRPVAPELGLSQTPGAVRQRAHRQRKAAARAAAAAQGPAGAQFGQQLPRQAEPQPETYTSGAKVAAEAGLSAFEFRQWVRGRVALRKLQRADGRWPLGATVALLHELVKAPAPQSEPPTAKDERRNIVEYVRGWCGAVGIATPEGFNATWEAIYGDFSIMLGYDPRLLKQKGERAIAVIERRGDLKALNDAVLRVCPPERMIEAAKAATAPQQSLPAIQ
jgi:hypothetical protein